MSAADTTSFIHLANGRDDFFSLVKTKSYDGKLKIHLLDKATIPSSTYTEGSAVISG